MVYVPELPGLRAGEVGPAAAEATLAVASEAAAGAPEGRVALVGVSTGGSLALVAARDRALAGRVSAVSAVAPFTDVRNVFRIATTGTYREGERVRPYRRRRATWPWWPAARSVALLPPGAERDRIGGVLRGVADTDPDPLAALAPLDGDVKSAEARAVLALLANRDPDRFDARWDDLSEEVRRSLARISPATPGPPVEAPIELVIAPRDKYFPVEELTTPRLSVRQRVTVTGALQHGDPAASLGQIADLGRLNGFVVRSLRDAGAVATRSPRSQPQLGAGRRVRYSAGRSQLEQ